jgi:hypothetical protein
MKNRNIQFHRVPMILTGVILLVLVTSASSSPAAGPQTYTGILTHGDFFCGGNPVDPQYSVTGTWILSIDPIMEDQVTPPAHLTLIVLKNGRHYLTFPHIELTPVPLVEDGVYVYLFGPSVTMTLDTNVDPATFSWHVELGGGCPPEHPYDSLTYVGVAN